MIWARVVSDHCIWNYKSETIVHCYFKRCLVPHIEYKAHSPDSLWRYLTARHDWSNISLWIEEFQTQETGPPHQNKWPPLSADIIDQNTCCNNYMKNKILDKLARYCNHEIKVQWGG